MEKLKITVTYNSINNLDVSGVPVRRRLPRVCFGSQSKSVQTQTDMITNVTVERFTNVSNVEKAAEFSRIIDISLGGNGCMEIDSNTLFVKYIMVKKFNISILIFFALFYIKKLLLHKREEFPRSVATSNAG